MAEYELTRTPDFVRNRDDAALIPNDPDNADWQRYQKWLADGGTPDPYPYANEKPVPEGVP